MVKTKTQMKKLIRILFPAAVAGLLLLSCDDYRNASLQEYDTLMYFRNGGEQELALYSTGEDGLYAIPVCKGGRNLSGTATVEIVPFDDNKMALYNAVNYTSYTALPQSMFSFLEDDASTPVTSNPLSLEFTAEESVKVVYLKMLTSEVQALMAANPDKTYVMGFQLFSEEKVSDDINILVLIPEVTVPYLTLSTTGLRSDAYDSDSAESATYDNRVKFGIDSNRWEFTCELEVKDQSWLDQYNADHGTSYDLLESKFYEMPKTLNFPKGVKEVPFSITVNRILKDTGEEMPKLRELVIPVAIKSCSKEEFVPFVSSEANDCVFLVQVLMSSDIPVTITADQVTAFYDGKTGYEYSNMFDGDESTFWASPGSAKWGGIPGDEEWGFWFDIHLTTPLSVFVMNYCASPTAVRCPTRIKLGISDDGVNYTLVKDVATEDMRALVGWHALPLVKSDTKFSYIRMGLLETYINDTVYPLNVADVDMTCEVAELKLYGSEN